MDLKNVRRGITRRAQSTSRTSTKRRLQLAAEVDWDYQRPLITKEFSIEEVRMKIYQYPNCNGCKKALRWLDDEGFEGDYESIDIVLQTPSRDEIKALWRDSGLDLKRFFNTSGKSWRALDLKQGYALLNDEERLDLLAGDGMLIKRPILRTEDEIILGFKPKVYEETLSTQKRGGTR